jgi:hypothetical protein
MLVDMLINISSSHDGVTTCGPPSAPNMDKKIKKRIRICANTKGAFIRMERFADNYAVDPKPEQLEVRLKLIIENWEKYNNVQDELE